MYGTTCNGGTNNLGTVFKLNTNGSGYTALYSFTRIGGDGAFPEAGLVQGSDGALYGTTAYGGTNGNGTAFRFVTPPIIVTEPQNAYPAAGGSASFTVVASGLPAPVYQWQLSGTNLANGGQISGATNTILTISDVGSNNLGSYTVVLTNAYGSVTSTVATLAIGAAPTITVQPQSQVRLAGSTVEFNVSATGTAPLSYQWQLNGGNLADGGQILGSASNVLTITGITSGNVGNYTVVVSNQLGSMTSSNASLAIASSAPFNTTLGSLTGPRAYQTATLLGNGKVLLAGGYGGTGGYLATAELFDPVSGTSTLTGTMASPHEEFTATLLPSGKVLVAGGYNGSNVIPNAEIYDPISGTWSSTGPLGTARQVQTATLLTNGQVLVAGGEDNDGNPLDSAELYNPATALWTPTGNLSTPRDVHTATLLPNGQVLVAGGYGVSGVITNAELYNPATGRWSPTGPLNTARGAHTATLLPSGQVLVAAGECSSGQCFVQSAELYNPATGQWTLTGNLNVARAEHAATLLPNAQVLVTGGYNGSIVASAELYDPATGQWTQTPSSMNTAREYHTATLLPGGDVLLAGGVGGGNTKLSSVEVYSLAAGAWTMTGSLNTNRAEFTITLLPTGKVLAAGGNSSGSRQATAELYDPSAGTWTFTGPMNAARADHTATLLTGGQVLVAGGDAVNGNGLSSSELFNPATVSWTPTSGSMVTPHFFHTATLLPNGQVLVAAGQTNNVGSPRFYGNFAELYDPANGLWSPTGPLNHPRASHTATLLTNGMVLVAGGGDGNSDLSSAELYNPTTGTWSFTPNAMNSARAAATATLLPDGNVLLAGGAPGGGNLLSSAEIYNPVTGQWTITGSMNTARYWHYATLLPNGKVLVAGGQTASGGFLASAELYDPATGTWTLTGNLNAPRYSPPSEPAVLLPSGQVLIAGGLDNNNYLSSAELYNVGLGFLPAWQPQITGINSLLTNGASLSVAGSGFRGIAEGSSGDSQDSPADYPVVQLRGLESERTAFLLPASWSSNSFLSEPVTGFPRGYALATVFVNGIPSASSLVLVGSPPTILTQPASWEGFAGSTVSLDVVAEDVGPIAYQWRYNGTNLTDGGDLTGSETNTLTFTGITAGQGGDYTVLLTGVNGSILSEPALVTVIPPGLLVIARESNHSVQLSFEPPFDVTSGISVSSNLVNWTLLTNLPPSLTPVYFIDHTSTNYSHRFYRAFWTQ